MSTPKRVLGIVMAGGRGGRGRPPPPPRPRSKPAVPFGGRYRIIDFVLSNLVNSGIRSIYVLTQYKAQSLLQHIQHGWMNRVSGRDNFIHVVPPPPPPPGHSTGPSPPCTTPSAAGGPAGAGATTSPPPPPPRCSGARAG